MIALKILMLVLALLALLLTVRVGGDIAYDAGGLRVYARVSRFTVCLYPTKKEKAPKKRKKTKSRTAKKGKPDITEDEVLDALGAAVRAVKKLRFRLGKLKLHFLSAFDDPYKTAIVYGYAEALLHGLGLPQLKQSDIQLGMDFEGDTCQVDGYLSVTIRIYYIIKLCLCLLWGIIPILWRRRKRMKSTVKNTTVKGMTV